MGVKIAVIGAGHVGSHVALECARQGLAEDVVLLDINRQKAKAQAADIEDAAAYASYDVHVYEGWYDEIKDADIAVMAACAQGYDSSDRLNELAPTLAVAREVAGELVACGFRGTVVSISNPCDLIAQYLFSATGLRVIGTGTALDSARLRVRVARALNMDVSSVQGWCLGEHGDSQVPALSTVSVGGVPLAAFAPGLDKSALQRSAIAAGWDIVTGKGCTEFGIGAATARLIRAILRDEGAVLACSVMLRGLYGAQDIYAGVPCRVGKDGAVPLPEFDLTLKEREALSLSFSVLKSHLPPEIEKMHKG